MGRKTTKAEPAAAPEVPRMSDTIKAAADYAAQTRDKYRQDLLDQLTECQFYYRLVNILASLPERLVAAEVQASIWAEVVGVIEEQDSGRSGDDVLREIADQAKSELRQITRNPLQYCSTSMISNALAATALEAKARAWSDVDDMVSGWLANPGRAINDLADVTTTEE